MRQFFVASYESLKDAAYNFPTRSVISRLAHSRTTTSSTRVPRQSRHRDAGVLAQYLPTICRATQPSSPRGARRTIRQRPFWDVRTPTRTLSPMAFTGRSLPHAARRPPRSIQPQTDDGPGDECDRPVSRIPEVPRIPEGLLLRSGVGPDATSVSAGLVYSVVPNVNLYVCIPSRSTGSLPPISRAIRSGPISARIARRA